MSGGAVINHGIVCALHNRSFDVTFVKEMEPPAGTCKLLAMSLGALESWPLCLHFEIMASAEYNSTRCTSSCFSLSEEIFMHKSVKFYINLLKHRHIFEICHKHSL
jgi:hypothetical protein